MGRPEYVAQRDIRITENNALAYVAGDPVAQGPVDNLNLEVGVDGDVLPVEGTLIPKPAKNAKRDDWVVYALSQGADVAELEDLGRDEIIALFDEAPGEADGETAGP